MADDLKTIVQRMVDANESEDNIALVIKRMSAQATPPETESPHSHQSVEAAQSQGFLEGAAGGAKGFAQGLVHSPVGLVKGLANIPHMIANPGETLDGLKQVPSRVMNSIATAGADPEGFGQSVGDATGQTMIGLAAPGVIGAADKVVPAVGRALEAHPGLGAIAGAGLGYAHGGVLGALEGGLTGGAIGRIGRILGAFKDAGAAAEGPVAETGSLSASDIASLRKQNYSEDMIQKIGKQPATPAPGISIAGLSSGKPVAPMPDALPFDEVMLAKEMIAKGSSPQATAKIIAGNNPKAQASLLRQIMDPRALDTDPIVAALAKGHQ